MYSSLEGFLHDLHWSMPVHNESLWISEADHATPINMWDDAECVPGAQEEAGQREGEGAVKHEPERRFVTRDGNFPRQHCCVGKLRALYAARSSEKAEFLYRAQHFIGPICMQCGHLGAAA